MGRKVGIPLGILPHVQGEVRARWKPLFQAVGVGSGLFKTEPGIRDVSHGQFYPNATTNLKHYK